MFFFSYPFPFILFGRNPKIHFKTGFKIQTRDWVWGLLLKDFAPIDSFWGNNQQNLKLWGGITSTTFSNFGLKKNKKVGKQNRKMQYMYKNFSWIKTKQWCALWTLNLLITNHDSLSTHKSKRNKWNWSSNFIENKSVVCIMKLKPFKVKSQFTPHITPTKKYIFNLKPWIKKNHKLENTSIANFVLAWQENEVFIIWTKAKIVGPPLSQSFKTFNTHDYEIKNCDLKVKGCKVEGATKHTHTHTQTTHCNLLPLTSVKQKLGLKIKFEFYEWSSHYKLLLIIITVSHCQAFWLHYSKDWINELKLHINIECVKYPMVHIMNLDLTLTS